MTFPFKAVLLDWAYTLVDLTGEDSRAAFGKVFSLLKEKGQSLPDIEEMFLALHKDFYEKIAVSRQTYREICFEDVLRSHLARYQVDLDGAVSMKDILQVYYEEIYSSRKVFADVIPTLQELKQAGVRMGIVSNTTNPGFMKDYEITLMGMDSYFEFAIYSSELTWRKPHAEIYREAIRRLGLKAGDILFVGDDLRMDVKGSQAAGMRAAWLNRDNEPALDGIVPDYALNSFSDLLKISCREK